jgi:hypothetical protein
MINTVNQLLDALANNNSRFVVDKSSIASMVAGQLVHPDRGQSQLQRPSPPRRWWGLFPLPTK